MTTTNQSEAYLAGVRAALADLPPEVRDELMEDLPAHLADIEAEHSGTLAERLGPPAVYAAELRAAAGLESRPTDGDRVATVDWQRVAAFGRRVDVRLGAVVGYPRMRDLLAALRPAWWLFRGWILACWVMLVATGRSAGLLPFRTDHPLAALVVLAGCVAFSVWLGRRTRTVTGWFRWLLVLGTVPLAFTGLVFVVQGSEDRADRLSSYADRWQGVSDVVAYDADGNPLTDIRLYDQNGNPIQLGHPWQCPDRGPAFGEQPQWVYPLCPSTQNGPGPIRRPQRTPSPAPHGSATPAPTASPAPASPVPTASPSPSAVP
ncbi:hypothetical protein R8Z50_33720 [Longispora sp. K20-0274]|uniref:HAAS signaling domain-containing protein n=1 Tax=Longispora sp. K20-0274 TaxID=3088255 RepID=UPI00399ACEA2